jgi:hypothetical protein
MFRLCGYACWNYWVVALVFGREFADLGVIWWKLYDVLKNVLTELLWGWRFYFCVFSLYYFSCWFSEIGYLFWFVLIKLKSVIVWWCFCLIVVWMNKCWLFLTDGTDWELSSWSFNIYSLDGLMPKIDHEIWVSCCAIILISTDLVKMIN